jgi:hypothetical protein
VVAAKSAAPAAQVPRGQEVPAHAVAGLAGPAVVLWERAARQPAAFRPLAQAVVPVWVVSVTVVSVWVVAAAGERAGSQGLAG